MQQNPNTKNAKLRIKLCPTKMKCSTNAVFSLEYLNKYFVK